VVAGSLWLVPCFLLARRLWGEAVALNAALLCLGLPIYIKFSTYALSEAVYVLALLWSLYWGHRALIDGGQWNYALTGFCFGLTILTRSEGTVFLAVFLVLVVGREARAGRLRQWRRWGGQVGIALVVYLLLLAPYAAYIHRHTGVWTATNQASYAARMTEAYAEGSDRAKAYEQAIFELSSDGRDVRMIGPGGGHYRVSLLSLALARPWGLLRIYLGNLYLLAEKLLYQLFPLAVLGLVLLGLLGSPWTRETIGKHAYLAAFILPVVVLFPLVNLDYRKVLPVTPLMLIWASLGTRRLSEFIDQTRDALRFRAPPVGGRPVSMAQVGAALSLLLVIQAYGEVTVPAEFKMATMYADRDQAAQADAGHWVRANSGADEVVMSRAPIVPFYAERVFRPFPYTEDVRRLAYYVRANRIRFLVLDDGVVNEQRRGELRYLFAWYDGRDLPGWLTTCYVAQRGLNKVAILAVDDRQLDAAVGDER
jgi:4-amino-4-deoxy-L-arabinose transferase-like glycosyltransferase